MEKISKNFNISSNNYAKMKCELNEYVRARLDKSRVFTEWKFVRLDIKGVNMLIYLP